jgi:photosystem II stability/assembly factor-like uncharacterized protein
MVTKTKRKSLSKKRKKQKPRKQRKKISEVSKSPHDPVLRHKATTVDIFSGSDDQPLSQLRLDALKDAAEMQTSDSQVSATAAPLLESRITVPPLSGGNNWVQLGPTSIPFGQTTSRSRVLVTGRVTTIVVDKSDPNIIYIGAAQGGVWKTIDAGRNWMAKSDSAESLAIGALAMDPQNHLVLYAGTGEGNIVFQRSYYGVGVLKSTDGGETWRLCGGSTNPLIGSRFFRLAINPLDTNTVFAATTYGLYKSTNGGEDWMQMVDGLPNITSAIIAATDVVINPINPSIVYTAFWGDGIYMTTNANSASPQWTKSSSGLTTTGFTRIALDISNSSPQIIHALMSNANSVIDKFYRTVDGGLSWTLIQLPNTIVWGESYPNSIGPQGTYNLNVAVDPTTPDIVYLSGVPLLKAVRNTATNVWGFKEIGEAIHPDNHAFAFHPLNNLEIYAGNDGGIYKSIDGGASWNDTINEGLCITQFEFMDQHPTSDAVIFGGTQDNGTQQFRNNSVFYHAADGDGGYVAIDPDFPNNVLHEYYNPTPHRSTEAGKFGRKGIDQGGTWIDVSRGLSGDVGKGTSLFYPPFTLDQSNSKNIALGTNKIFLDTNQGTNRWRTSIELPVLTTPGEVVTAINYVRSDLIYVGTNQGKVFRLTQSSRRKWSADAIQASPLPTRFIWDIATHPNDINTIFVVMAGFGSRQQPLSHVWRGKVSETATSWTDISKWNGGRLPDIPVNAIAIEPDTPDTMYIGTDLGVFKTNNGGSMWTRFSQGLPNCAVFDMRLQLAKRLLRAVTHGRGIWEFKLDAQTMSDVDIFVRDHLMDTGRFTPSPDNMTAAFEDLLHNVKLGDSLSWSMCADIKVDSPFYQMNIDDVDYVAFETKLQHRNPQRGRINRVYVQVHNRGIKSADNVTVKIFYADTSNGYPPLPSDFWTSFPNDPSDTINWKPIGKPQILPSPPKTLTNTEPTILAWEWSTTVEVADNVGLLVIADSSEDPIPGGNKIFNVADLVRNEKHVGLRDLNVIDV